MCSSDLRMNTGGAGTTTGGGGFSDVFGGLFNRGGGARSRARRGADVESTVTLSFDEALEGVTLPLRLTSEAPCQVCSGTGARNGTVPRVCPSCDGAGQVNRAEALCVMFVNTTGRKAAVPEAAKLIWRERHGAKGG